MIPAFRDISTLGALANGRQTFFLEFVFQIEIIVTTRYGHFQPIRLFNFERGVVHGWLIKMGLLNTILSAAAKDIRRRFR